MPNRKSEEIPFTMVATDQPFALVMDKTRVQALGMKFV
jgi:hypothetical protein